MVPSEVPRLATHLLVRVFLGVWKLLSLLRLLSWDGSLSLPLLSLFIFYIFSYLLLKTMGCLSARLMSSASIKKFCGNCSVVKCPFNEFVGEKEVSLSYSSAILGPPPDFFFNKFIYLFLAALRWIFVVAHWLHCLSACGNFPGPKPGSTSLAGRFLITGQPTRQLLSSVIIKNEMI